MRYCAFSACLLVLGAAWRPRLHFEARANIACTSVNNLQGRRLDTTAATNVFATQRAQARLSGLPLVSSSRCGLVVYGVGAKHRAQHDAEWAAELPPSFCKKRRGKPVAKTPLLVPKAA